VSAVNRAASAASAAREGCGVAVPNCVGGHCVAVRGGPHALIPQAALIASSAVLHGAADADTHAFLGDATTFAKASKFAVHVGDAEADWDVASSESFSSRVPATTDRDVRYTVPIVGVVDTSAGVVGVVEAAPENSVAAVEETRRPAGLTFLRAPSAVTSDSDDDMGQSRAPVQRADTAEGEQQPQQPLVVPRDLAHLLWLCGGVAVRELGRGTYGVVYEATVTTATGAVCRAAVKVPSSNKHKVDWEANMLRSVQGHPNILAIVDVDIPAYVRVHEAVPLRVALAM
jgi:hypothetical protein